MNPWQQVHELAARLAEGRESVRLANLALAAAAAAEEPFDGKRLRSASEKLALAGDLECERDAKAWRELAKATPLAARRLRGVAGHDAWVQASQEADRARKSRGAYATPRSLADPMARLLLRPREDPPERILDPSAGGGALLLAVLRRLVGRRSSGSELAAAARRLYGVELDPVARELCCLQVWLACRGAEGIASIASRIRCDNAITRDWGEDEPYDALIMNPPWESLRHAGGTADQEERRLTVERLQNPHLDLGSGLPPLFSHQGRGDRNLYKAFLELALHLVREGAPIVALVPGAWSSDLGTRQLRELYLTRTSLEQWTSFENRKGYFPIDGRYKFGILRARRDPAGTRSVRVLGMAGEARQLSARHIRVAASALPRIGGPSQLIPDLVSREEVRLLRKYAAAGAPLFEKSALGRVAYERELDLTVDRQRGKFRQAQGARRVGPTSWSGRGRQSLHPLVEGRMVGQYDFFEKSWLSGAGRTATWTYNNGHRLADCTPQFLAPPAPEIRSRLAICDITSATNTRTVHVAWLPGEWRCGNTAPVLVFEDETPALAALAVLNSFVFDWQARRIVSGLHLNRFYLDAMHWPKLDTAEVELLARRALEVLSLNRRFREVAPETAVSPSQVDYLRAHVEIEGIVAAGYGLTMDDLVTVFDPDEADRRGFWRAYRSDPNAAAIAERVTRTGVAV